MQYWEYQRDGETKTCQTLAHWHRTCSPDRCQKCLLHFTSIFGNFQRHQKKCNSMQFDPPPPAPTLYSYSLFHNSDTAKAMYSISFGVSRCCAAIKIILVNRKIQWLNKKEMGNAWKPKHILFLNGNRQWRTLVHFI